MLWWDRLHPDDFGRFQDWLHDRSASEMGRAIEHRMRTHDGASRWFITRAARRDGTGSSGLLLGVSLDVTELKELQSVERDITARKLAEEELRQSEESYRLLFEQSPDLMALVVDGGIRFANARLEPLSGYTLDEIRGRSPTDLLIADDRTRAMARIREVLAGAPPTAGEYRMLRRDGTIRTVEVYSQRIRFHGAVALVAVIRDVEERRRTEEQLRESEAAYRTLIEEHPDLVVLSVDGLVEYANARLSGFGGYALPEVRGRSLFDFVAPEDLARARERAAKILETGDPSAAEYRLLRKDGTTIHVDVRSQRVHLRGRTGLLSIIRDVDERRRAEEELRASEEAYRTLIEEIPGPVLLIVDGRLDYTNQAFRRMSGYTLDELRGHSPMEFICPEDAPRAAQRMQEILDGAPSHPSEYRAIARDGTLHPIEIRTQRIHYRGKTGLLSIIYDVAERKRTEDTLRRHSADLEQLIQERTAQIRELERQRAASESTAAIGRMAARIAHEINNPLAGIKNSFRLIKDAVTPEHPYHSYVALIEREIGRIAGIVRQMFDIYRPDQGTAQEIRLGSLLGDVITLLEPRCQPRRIGIRVGPMPDEVIILPPGYLSQVLFNIILNAVEASPPGGVVHIGATFGPDVATVTVADQGSGIPEDLRERVFEPFFTTKGEGAPSGGLGLGLSVSRGLMEAMGGTIRFESRIGAGTTFYLSLPRRGPLKEAESG
ncbi:MAG: PAS domain S-box protein [Candidatus Zixiibacteriota bacterium]